VRLLRRCTDLEAWRRSCGEAPLHFVPTMGALHPGHQSLIARAGRRQAGVRPQVLVSVFVNPLQFGANEDFGRYPRQLERDAELAEAAGADALFAPSVEELYPAGEGELQLLLGEKDWQQLVILQRMAADLGLPVRVVGCPTLREPDGLALSSRNSYLSAEQRRQAAALPQALQAAAATPLPPGSDLAPTLMQVRQALERAGLVLDYVEAVCPRSLQPRSALTGLTLLAAAAHCGPSRLIDHVFLMSRAPIVAIDGPAGAGKSTVTRAFAERLGLIYLDTGAMYRGVTWLVQQSGVDAADAAAVAPLLQDLDLQLSTAAAGSQRVLVNGHDVTEAIRSPEVTAQVSVVAAHGCVREALTRQQQAMGERGGLVAEGRDIGTAVFPDAELKVFLTATTAERARRRALDLEQRGFPVPALQELEAQIAERDHLDSTRDVAPLTQAADAVELITDGLSIEAVIDQLVQLFRERVPHDAWPEPGS